MPIVKSEPLLSDIWLTTVPFLDTPTLNSISRTSSSMNELLRPILYRNLHLYCNSEHAAATLNLMCSHEELALRVISLTLGVKPYPSKLPGNLGHFIEALEKMTSLKNISMLSSVFMYIPEEEKEPFLGKLKHFNECSNLTNVSNLTWDVHMPCSEFQIMNPVWKILNSSSGNLRHLSFPSWRPGPSTGSLDRLRFIHAPFLRSFNIGSWVYNDADVINSFLLSHVGIEELDFSHHYRSGARAVDTGLILFAFLNIVSQEALLPNLRVLRGSLHALYWMMPRSMHCLSSRLETLSLNITSWIIQFDDTSHPYMWSFLHSLKELIIIIPTILYDSFDDEEFEGFRCCMGNLINSSKESLQRFAIKQSSCSDLSMIYLVSLLFGSAKRLTSVYISIPRAAEGVIKDIVSQFSGSCTSTLEEVWFIDWMRDEKKYDIKVTFMRNNCGEVLDVVVEEGIMDERIKSEFVMYI